MTDEGFSGTSCTPAHDHAGNLVDDCNFRYTYDALALDTRASFVRVVGSMGSYVCILRCTDGRHSYGSTNDLHRRLAEHRRGGVRTTSSRLPVELVYFEACESPEQARQKELAFKGGRTRAKAIQRMIATFPNERVASFAEPRESRVRPGW